LNRQQKQQERISGGSLNLFVYGTLMKGYELHRLLKQPGVSFLGCAHIRAKLFELPGEDYPAAIPDPNSYTYGELYRLDIPQKYLAEIDEIEGCHEGLFERRLIRAWQNGRARKAWTYFYSRSLKGAKEIAGGDYRKAGLFLK
jgi:gamma-glutamylcyclotransferase (GGCT)/AIG2-like uncharacterized protein YtfP